jgi:CheY-like chemotaxis protein
MLHSGVFRAVFQIGTEPSSAFVFNPRDLLLKRQFSGGESVGQSRPLRATALIVEDDPMQREMICLLLEESDYNVIQCESAEAAELVVEKVGGCLSLLMTDVNLAGSMNGVELAHIAKERNPSLDVVVTSGRPLKQPLPDGAKFWPKPWAALDVLREAQVAQTIGNAASS